LPNELRWAPFCGGGYHVWSAITYKQENST
jgi:hypothetical protein